MIVGPTRFRNRDETFSTCFPPSHSLLVIAVLSLDHALPARGVPRDLTLWPHFFSPCSGIDLVPKVALSARVHRPTRRLFDKVQGFPQLLLTENLSFFSFLTHFHSLFPPTFVRYFTVAGRLILLSTMPSTMNHLYHTLSPLILLTAFLVSLLAFLAPTPIFADRVSLLTVSLKSSSTSKLKRFIPEAVLDPPSSDRQRMVKRAKKLNAASSTKEVEFVYGPLGEFRSLHIHALI